MKKFYLEPTIDVFLLNTTASLLAGSITETLDDATDIDTGDLDAREFVFGDDFSFDDDNDF